MSLHTITLPLLNVFTIEATMRNVTNDAVMVHSSLRFGILLDKMIKKIQSNGVSVASNGLIDVIVSMFFYTQSQKF